MHPLRPEPVDPASPPSSSHRRRQRVDSNQSQLLSPLIPPDSKRQRSSSSFATEGASASDIAMSTPPGGMSAKAKGKQPQIGDMHHHRRRRTHPRVVDVVNPNSHLNSNLSATGIYDGDRFRPYMGAKKLVIKNLRASLHTEEIEQYYQRARLEVDNSVEEILAGRPHQTSLTRLFRNVEDICTHGQAQALYMKLKAQCDEHMAQTVLPQIHADTRGASNTVVLRAVYEQWQTWSKTSTLIRSIFSFLDRTYLLKERTLPQLDDMLITRFRRMVFDGRDNDPDNPPPGKQVLAGMCDLITLDRLGDRHSNKNDGSSPPAQFDGTLLREAVSMVHVLNVYGRYFEPAFMNTSERYLHDFAADWQQQQQDESASSGGSSHTSSSKGIDIIPYIRAVESLLILEDIRCNTYNLDSSTKKMLLDRIQQLLIINRVNPPPSSSSSPSSPYLLLHSTNIARLLESGDVNAARTLYQLLRLPRLQKELRAPWENYIETVGTEIVVDNSGSGEDMVVRLLLLRRRLLVLVQEAFAHDDDFAHGLRSAFGRFINGRSISAAWASGAAKVGEMVAKHVDMLLRGGLKTLPEELLKGIGEVAAEETLGGSTLGESTAGIGGGGGGRSGDDSELDRQLDHALELFRFIQGKDVFEAFYKKDLARRLLMGRSASQDAERNMLTKLKTECGSNLTHNLEQMFRDQDLSRDEMNHYQEWLKGNEAKKMVEASAAEKSDSATPKRQKRVDLQVTVLSAAAWPTYPDVDLALPSEVLKEVQLFDAYYKSKHTGRQLSWKHTLGHCVIQARFPRGVKELLVSALQAAVLLLFNQVVVNDDSTGAKGKGKGKEKETEASESGAGAGALTYAQIASSTGLEGGDLDRTLQSLACGKVRVLSKYPKGRDVQSTDTFTVNRTFSDPRVRIKINQIQLKETRAENAATYERVNVDRQFETQAAIVRIMKSRKSLAHAQLVAEVISQTKSRGALDPADIKQNIEKLIEKEYLDREGGNYVYLA